MRNPDATMFEKVVDASEVVQVGEEREMFMYFPLIHEIVEYEGKKYKAFGVSREGVNNGNFSDFKHHMDALALANMSWLCVQNFTSQRFQAPTHVFFIEIPESAPTAEVNTRNGQHEEITAEELRAMKREEFREEARREIQSMNALLDRDMKEREARETIKFPPGLF